MAREKPMTAGDVGEGALAEASAAWVDIVLRCLLDIERQKS